MGDTISIVENLSADVACAVASNVAGGGHPFPTIRCQSACGAGQALSPP